MSDPLVRVAVVALAALAALAVAGVARIMSGRHGPKLDVWPLISEPGVVVFTKDDCSNCAAVLALLGPSGVTVRQVRAESEQEVFTEMAIEGVPVTVVVAAEGRPVAQFAGLPRPAALRRALRRVGEIPSS